MTITCRIHSRWWLGVLFATTVVACGSDDAQEPELYIPQPTPWSPTPPKKEAERPADARPPRVPNPADGVCKRAVVSSGVVDPDCVYVLGRTREVLPGAELEVLIDPLRPEDRAFGFAQNRRIIVHPTTGELWFLAHDNKQHDAMYVLEENVALPDSTLFKQRLVPNPVCSTVFPAPFDFRLFADDGVPLYECEGGLRLMPTQTEPFEAFGGVVLAASHDRAVLTLNPPSSYTIVKDGIQRPIGWTEYQRFIAARSRPGGGFIAATYGGTFPNHLPNLWDVELDGTIATRGTYDLGPEGMVDIKSSGWCTLGSPEAISCGGVGYDGCALEPSGALWCVNVIATEKGRTIEGVVRFTQTGPPQIVYDSRARDVKVSTISKLVTGP